MNKKEYKSFICLRNNDFGGLFPIFPSACWTRFPVCTVTEYYSSMQSTVPLYIYYIWVLVMLTFAHEATELFGRTILFFWFFQILELFPLFHLFAIYSANFELFSAIFSDFSYSPPVSLTAPKKTWREFLL